MRGTVSLLVKDRLKQWPQSFPDSSVGKNLTARTGDMGPIPGPKRSHMLQNNYAWAQLLSLCSRAWELQLLKPTHPRAHALQQEKPPQWEVHAPQLEKSPRGNEDPAQPQIKQPVKLLKGKRKNNGLHGSLRNNWLACEKPGKVSGPPKVTWLVAEWGPESRCPDHLPPALLPLTKPLGGQSREPRNGIMGWRRGGGWWAAKKAGKAPGEPVLAWTPTVWAPTFQLCFLAAVSETLGPFTSFPCASISLSEMATHSSVLDWRIPGTAEHGGLPSMGSHRVGHDWSDLAAEAAISLSGKWTMIIWITLRSGGLIKALGRRPDKQWGQC